MCECTFTQVDMLFVVCDIWEMCDVPISDVVDSKLFTICDGLKK